MLTDQEEHDLRERDPHAAGFLKFFEFEHLPPHLAEAIRPICELAHTVMRDTPPGPEKSAGLRKLLEAKDCIVRAHLATVS